MDNLILENNLKFIEKYDKKLADEIRGISELKNDITLVETDECEPNLAFNGIEIHARSGAEAEARDVAASVSNDSLLSIHVVFGLGLGYLFREMVSVSKGSVILYEPDIEILRVTLEMVDFTLELSKSNVFVVNKIDGLESKYDILFAYQSKTTFEFLNFYKSVFETQMNEVLDKLGKMQSVYSQNSMHRKEGEYKYLLYSIYSLYQTIRYPMLKKIENKFKNVPAVIVSPGASLNKNIDVLKDNRDKVVVFAVTTSMSVLNKHGVKADFLSAVETFDESGVLKDSDFRSISLIVEPYVHRNVVLLPFGQKFVTCSKETDANAFWANLKGISREDYESKGTVSYNALFAAKMLGCNPIILIGQDLAYVDGRCYSKESVFRDLLCVKNRQTQEYEIKVDNFDRYKDELYARLNLSEEEKTKRAQNKIKKLQEQLFMVDSQNGEKIPSSSTFALFIEYFKSFAQNYGGEVDLYNASSGGADIFGFKNVDLESVLTDLSPLTLDIAKIIKESIGQQQFDAQKLVSQLKTEVDCIDKAISQISSSESSFYALMKELRSRNVLTEKLLTNLKKSLGSYVSLSEVMEKSSICYKIATYNSKVAVDYALKTFGNVTDIGSTLKISEALKEFYENDLAKLKNVLAHLRRMKGAFENEIAAAKG